MWRNWSLIMPLSLVIFLFLISLSCSKDPTSSGPSSFSVSGRIIDSTGNSVSGVSVILSDKSAVSDSTGTYNIQGLVNGSYAATFSLSGYSIEPSAKQFTISDSSLELAAVIATPIPSTYIISGYIIGLDDSGVAEVIMQLSGNGVAESAVSDSTGAYSFTGISNGAYTLTPAKYGYTFNPSTKQFVVAGADASVPNIRVSSIIYPISGRVVDKDGGGVYGVEVNISGGGVEQTETTNQSGFYSYEGALGTTYTMTYTKEEYKFNPFEFKLEVDSPDDTVDDVVAILVQPEITFVIIPAVTTPYVMNPDEGGTYSITLSAYEMSMTEVTNAQYAKYLNLALTSGDITATSSSVTGASGEWSGQEYIDLSGNYISFPENDCKIVYSNEAFSVKPGYEYWPVTFVSWYGSKAFAEYYGFDLPTEAEWQYAASGGRNYEYGTDDGTISISNVNYVENIEHPVDGDSYPANPFGLYNMSGNVMEWCNDLYGSYPNGSVNNPTGALTGHTRIMRGGNYSNLANLCRSTYRGFGMNPYHTLSMAGFRVVSR